MHISKYQNAKEYLSKNENYLIKEEAMNSLLLGLSLSNKANENNNDLFFDVRDQDGIHFTAIKLKGRNLIVSGSRSKLEEVAPLLFKFLEDNKIDLPGIAGEKDLVLEMAHILQRDFNWNFKVTFEQLVYAIDKIKFNPQIEGSLQKGSLNDIANLSQWMNQFLAEAFGELNLKEATETIKRKIDNAELYVWCKDEKVSMCCIARPTVNGITINYVFTPKQHRRKGYGTKLVAELSSLMLKQGYKFCTLFTDMNNPTSNKIYTKIGYEPLGEFRTIKFNVDS